MTLGEGGTPLLPAPVLSELTGCEVYLKFEGMNPTGSFKDRGMTVAVSLAAARGRPYSDLRVDRQYQRERRRLRGQGRARPASCWCRAARSRTASSPRPSSTARGCCRSTATSTTAWSWCASSPSSYPVAVVNSVNPDRLAGQKTAAFEIVDALGDAPDVHCLPVGNAGQYRPRTGWATRSTSRRAARPRRRRWRASRRPARRRWSAANR